MRWCLVVLLAYSVPSAAALEAFALQADLVPLHPVSVEGHLDLPAGTYWNWTGPFRADQEAHALVVRIVEERWEETSLPGAPRSTLASTPGARAPASERVVEMYSARVQVTGSSESAASGSIVGAEGQDLRLGTRCEFRTAAAPPPHGPETWIEATCRGLEARLSQAVVWSPHEAVLEATYAERAGDDPTRTLRIETGYHSYRDPLNPLVTHHVDRRTELRSVAGSVLEIASSDLEARVVAPSFVAAGEWTIPPATGTIRWGAAVVNDPARPLPVEGAMGLEAADATTVHLAGHTVTRPPAAVLPASEGFPAAVAVSAVLAPFALAGLAWAWRSFVAAFFTRLSQSKALDLEGRRLVHEFVAANPGSNIQAIARGIGMNRGTLRHHLRVLRREGFVVERRSGRSRTLFLPGVPATPTDARRERLLAAPATQRLLHLLRQDPRATQRSLAQRLGVVRSAVSYRVRELAELGLLRVERFGRTNVYEVAVEERPETVPSAGPALADPSPRRA